MKAYLALAAATAALFLAMPAHAAVLVVGDGPERGCYLAAKTGSTAMESLRLCNDALTNSALLLHDRAATFVNRGVIQVALGRTDAAMDDFNACLAIMPDQADAFLNRGVVYIVRKQYDQALVEIQKGFALKPSDMAVAYYDRAVAEEALGRLRDAYTDYQLAAKEEPTFTAATDAVGRFKIITKGAT